MLIAVSVTGAAEGVRSAIDPHRALRPELERT
jgi:hypothetical protein